jgi:hypothetical protein
MTDTQIPIKGFSMPRNAAEVHRPYGYGIEALDMQGRLVEIPGTVPMQPRKKKRASCAAPIRGDGSEVARIGKPWKDDIVPNVRPKLVELSVDDKIIDAYRSGLTIVEAAKACGVTEWHVRRILAKSGVPGRPVN